MVSAQIAGTIAFYRKTPNGSLILLFAASTALLGPSGSSEGVVASTPEKWTYLPLQNSTNKVLQPGDHLVATFKPVAAATTGTATKSIWQIPVTLPDGTATILNSPADSTEWDVQQLPAGAFLASREVVVAEKTARAKFALGSNTTKVFASVENNS